MHTKVRRYRHTSRLIDFTSYTYAHMDTCMHELHARRICDIFTYSNVHWICYPHYIPFVSCITLHTSPTLSLLHFGPDHFWITSCASIYIYIYYLHHICIFFRRKPQEIRSAGLVPNHAYSLIDVRCVVLPGLATHAAIATAGAKLSKSCAKVLDVLDASHGLSSL